MKLSVLNAQQQYNEIKLWVALMHVNIIMSKSAV